MAINETTIQAYYQAVRLMFSDKPVNAGMKDLDRTARGLVRHPVWDQLRQIDFASELPALQEWVAQEVSQHKDGIAILHFRLADLGDRMSLVFLRPRRQPSGDSDWDAYEESHSAVVPSRLLAQMAEIAEAELLDEHGSYTNEDAGWIVETCYPLAYAGLAVAQIMHKLPPAVLLGSDTTRKVAVFFPEGDDFFLGEITEKGFSYASVPDFIV